MCEPRKENLGQLGTAAIFWLILRAFFSMLPRLRLSFSLQITLPNHRDQKKASDHEDDPHVCGSHELHHRHENESLDDHDQHYLDLEAQDQTIDHDPKWDRRSHAQKKEEAVMMTLRPLWMEAIMVPYSRSGGLIITDSLSFPRYHFKNSSFCLGESSSRSASNGNDDKSSFSLSTSTTATTGSTTLNSSVVSSPLSSSSKYGRKPVLPKDYPPNSTKIGNLHINVRENDQNQTQSPLHDPDCVVYRSRRGIPLEWECAPRGLPNLCSLDSNAWLCPCVRSLFSAPLPAFSGRKNTFSPYHYSVMPSHL
ncbi:hypothetical protein TorRG33x02_242140 [Trema orientale]|uniref:Transmembrane protein n=1 Tax=Trema orientale TaxID=63057 RepID=A0A2P5DU25_TREOI|nr:hypothetical protein TorRG33x02_242140 [Trema orientale]